MKHFEKTLDSAEIYNGKIIRVFRDEVLLENGKTAAREVVRHGGAAAVLAIDENGGTFLVRQFRYPVGRELLEVPAGKLDAGETPLSCARRELLEECGLIAAEWQELGPYLSSPGFCDEVIWLFIAKGLSFAAQSLDEDEFLDVVRLPLAEAAEMVMKDVIADGKTQALVLRAAAAEKQI